MVVRAELPGVDPEKDVTVSLDGDVLTIHAVRRDERREQAKGGGQLSEFRYGESVRTMRIPSGADPDAVDASYTDGILEVRLPIPRSSDKPRRIAVKRDGGQ
jgi:HSP20 family protein